MDILTHTKLTKALSRHDLTPHQAQRLLQKLDLFEQLRDADNMQESRRGLCGVVKNIERQLPAWLLEARRRCIARDHRSQAQRGYDNLFLHNPLQAYVAEVREMFRERRANRACAEIPQIDTLDRPTDRARIGQWTEARREVML